MIKKIFLIGLVLSIVFLVGCQKEDKCQVDEYQGNYPGLTTETLNQIIKADEDYQATDDFCKDKGFDEGFVYSYDHAIYCKSNLGDGIEQKKKFTLIDYYQWYGLIVDEQNSKEERLNLTLACEQGCIIYREQMSEDLKSKTPREVGKCIFECNNKYYFQIEE